MNKIHFPLKASSGALLATILLCGCDQKQHTLPIEEKLPTELFFKATRAQIVNLEAIQSLEPWFSNTLRATLRNGVIVEFSRRASLAFRESQGL